MFNKSTFPKHFPGPGAWILREFPVLNRSPWKALSRCTLLASSYTSSSESSDTLPPSMTSDTLSSPPVKETSSSLDDRPPTPPKPAPSTMMPRCASRSGFYNYCGQPSYFGTHLFQPSDLVPEEGIFGEWIELGYGETSSTRLVMVMPDAKLAAA